MSLTRRSFAACLLSGSCVPVLAARKRRPEAGKKLKPTLVSTMRGPVSPQSLGRTLMHEHVLWFGGPGARNAGYLPIPETLRDDSVEFAVSLLNDAARAGIRTIVDMTPHRPIDLYRQIAARTSVQIVPSTGFYRRSKIPKSLAAIEDEREMQDRMLKEVTEGIGGTSIRAGIIKIASEGAPLTDWEKKVFRAAAGVQSATGIRIGTHSGLGSAVEQYELLLRNGADPHRIMLSRVDVGTSSRRERLETLLPIVKQGGYLETDTFGQEFYTPWKDLVAFLRFFCDAGFANQLFISIDCNWHWENGIKLFEGAEPPARDPNASNRTYAYMMKSAVPNLLASGFHQQTVDTFLTENPRRFFADV